MANNKERENISKAEDVEFSQALADKNDREAQQRAEKADERQTSKNGPINPS